MASKLKSCTLFVASAQLLATTDFNDRNQDCEGRCYRHLPERPDEAWTLGSTSMPARCAEARRHHGARIKVDSAYKSDLGRVASIDQPAFLMLAESEVRPVPADAETRLALFQKFAVGLDAREGRTNIGIGRFGIGPPDDHADVETARGRLVQHIEKGSPPVWHEKV